VEDRPACAGIPDGVLGAFGDAAGFEGLAGGVYVRRDADEIRFVVPGAGGAPGEVDQGAGTRDLEEDPAETGLAGGVAFDFEPEPVAVEGQRAVLVEDADGLEVDMGEHRSGLASRIDAGGAGRDRDFEGVFGGAARGEAGGSRVGGFEFVKTGEGEAVALHLGVEGGSVGDGSGEAADRALEIGKPGRLDEELVAGLAAPQSKDAGAIRRRGGTAREKRRERGKDTASGAARRLPFADPRPDVHAGDPFRDLDPLRPCPRRARRVPLHQNISESFSDRSR